MLSFKEENIFNQNVEAIVNPVNCVGVMGAGLALQFKNLYPENFIYYRQQVLQGNVKFGKMLVYTINTPKNPKYIINFPTKNHFKDKSYLKDIESGLQTLVTTLDEHDINSIAIPLLGCGLGGLPKKVVISLLHNTFFHLLEKEVIILI